mmetsp:Transcript_9003/g.16619  ORF Transcript_9003/g.16619 Transcript_9003/m.16619 type:complete len:111 (-) Transcript_9003:175-507(-)
MGESGIERRTNAVPWQPKVRSVCRKRVILQDAFVFLAWLGPGQIEIQLKVVEIWILAHHRVENEKASTIGPFSYGNVRCCAKLGPPCTWNDDFGDKGHSRSVEQVKRVII